MNAHYIIPPQKSKTLKAESYIMESLQIILDAQTMGELLEVIYVNLIDK